MKQTIDPGTGRPAAFFFDHLMISHTTGLTGNPVSLDMSPLCHMNRCRLQRTPGRSIPKEIPARQMADEMDESLQKQAALKQNAVCGEQQP